MLHGANQVLRWARALVVDVSKKVPEEQFEALCMGARVAAESYYAQAAQQGVFAPLAARAEEMAAVADTLAEERKRFETAVLWDEILSANESKKGSKAESRAQLMTRLHARQHRAAQQPMAVSGDEALELLPLALGRPAAPVRSGDRYRLPDIKGTTASFGANFTLQVRALAGVLAQRYPWDC